MILEKLTVSQLHIKNQQDATLGSIVY